MRPWVVLLTLVCVIRAVGATLDASQCPFIQALYNQCTSHASGGDFCSLDFSGPCNGWDTILSSYQATNQVDGNGFFTQLYISGAPRLTGTIPSSVSTLSRLTYLNLNDNSFYGSIPAEMNTLTLLLAGAVSRNCLTGTVPDLSAVPLTANFGQLATVNNLLVGDLSHVNALNNMDSTAIARCCNGTASLFNPSSSCVSCLSGYWFNGTACAVIPTCSSGYYWSGSSCVQCEVGYYCPTQNTRTACAAGTYSAAAAATASSVCQTCIAGTYAASGSSTCTACTSGSWSPAGSGSCTTCGTGLYTGYVWDGHLCVVAPSECD